MATITICDVCDEKGVTEMINRQVGKCSLCKKEDVELVPLHGAIFVCEECEAKFLIKEMVRDIRAIDKEFEKPHPFKPATLWHWLIGLFKRK